MVRHNCGGPLMLVSVTTGAVPLRPVNVISKVGLVPELATLIPDLDRFLTALARFQIGISDMAENGALRGGGRLVFTRRNFVEVLREIRTNLLVEGTGRPDQARLVRATMLEVLRQDYIRTARAKGLGSQVVLLRHALRNSMIPVATVLGPALAGLITGPI